MKIRKSLFVAVLLAATFLFGLAAAQAQTKPEFSKPILIGGENGAGPPATQTTPATNLKFFIHPKPTAATKNFSEPDGKLQSATIPPTATGDIAATPGAQKGVDITIEADSPMLDHPGDRTPSAWNGIVPHNGISPDDLSIGMGGTWYKLGIDLKLGASGRNQEAGRLVLADLRSDTGTDFNTIFGTDPLEEGLVGSAAAEAPYDQYYPASVIKRETPFSWCKIPYFLLPAKNYAGCPTPNEALGGITYTDVFLYDFADVGNGFIATSYDPLKLAVDAAGYVFITPPGAGTEFSLPFTDAIKNYAYYSPLALFRKVSDAGSERYRFTGYTSWELPVWDLVPTAFTKLWQFIATNWILPVALNPIATEAVDRDGASSWRQCPDPAACLAGMSHPDTDLAVAYQNTLFGLDTYIYNFAGRPAVYGDGVHKLRDVLMACTAVNASGNCTAMVPLTTVLFPDNVISLMLYWKQERPWHVGDDLGPYTATNPSHVFNPDGEMSISLSPLSYTKAPGGAIVGPGMYDTAVLTDFAKDVAARDQHVLVPSGCPESSSDPLVTACPGGGVIYDISNANARLWFKTYLPSYSAFSWPPPTYTCNPQGYPLTAGTPLYVPDVLRIERPVSTGAAGFVPYRVRSGDLDGNACADYVVTWRGANTIKNDATTTDDKDVKFDDGTTSRMFANRVSVMLRHEETGKCVATAIASYPAGIPAFIDVPSDGSGLPQVAAAAIGDVDGDGINDIVAGNLTAETVTGAPADSTGFTSIFRGSKAYSTLPDDMVHVRMGFKTGADLAGVADVEVDNTRKAPGAIAAINGLPLMLPDIGCPNYADPNDPTVASVFETYTSIFANWMAKQKTMSNAWLYDPSHKFPFIDADARPMPERCIAPPPFCVKAGHELPFYADDPCCLDICAGGQPPSWWFVDPSSSDADPTNDYLPAVNNLCAQYLAKYLPYSCDAADYYFAWAACPSAQNSTPSIEQLNRGLAQSNWKPDQVWSPDRHAIAVAADLVPAQAAANALTPQNAAGIATQATNIAGAIAAAAPTSMEAFQKRLEQQQGNLFFPEIEITEYLAQIIESSARDNPEMLKMAEEVRTNTQFNKDFNEYISTQLIAPPLSFEDLFLQKIVSGAIMGAKEGAGERRLDVKGNTVTKRSAMGCSLIVDKVSKGASAVLDVIVPNAYAGGPCAVADWCKYGPSDTECWSSGATVTDYQCMALTSTCERGGICGDGCKNGTEDCDFMHDTLFGTDTNNGCALGTICKPLDPSGNGCTCEPPAHMKFDDLKLPKGQFMPGHREMTAVVLKSASLCAPANGVKEGTEECDLYGIDPVMVSGKPTSAAYLTRLGEDCAPLNGFAAQNCEINCKCAYPDAAYQQGATALNDCFNHADTFSGDATAQIYQKLNDAVRTYTGRTDDLFGEEEQGLTMTCRTGGTSAPGIAAGSLSLSLSGAVPLDGSDINMTPFIFAQRKGSRFIDSTTLVYKGFELVSAAERLFPVEAAGAQTMKAVVLPQLSASDITGAAPLTATSVAAGTGGAMIVNNMIEHRAYAMVPGAETGLSASVVSELPPGSGITVHEIKFRIPPGYASWTGVEGYTGAPNIEDRALSLDQIKADIQLKRGGGIGGPSSKLWNAIVGKAEAQAAPATCKIYTDLPWEENYNYNFVLAQEQYVVKGEVAKPPLEVPCGFLASLPYESGQGGCGCTISSSATAAQSALPWVIALLIPGAGIMVWRMRRK